MGCEEDVAKIGKKLEKMVASGTTVSFLHIIRNKQMQTGSAMVVMMTTTHTVINPPVPVFVDRSIMLPVLIVSM